MMSFGLKPWIILPSALLILSMGSLGFAQNAKISAGKTADKNPGHLKIALVNMKCQTAASDNAEANKAAIDANLKRHLYFIDKAIEQGAEFVGFPELSINGYKYSKTMPWLSLTGPEVGVLAAKAKEKGIYISAGLAEQDEQGKKWNTQIVIAPDGKIVGKHHKIWLTAENGFTEKGTDHNVFEVKGVKMGIVTCADGTDYNNLKAKVDKGAQILYGPHANTTGSTVAGWYNFRSRWGGKWNDEYTELATSNNGPKAKVPAKGWVNQLGVYAVIHNHAGLFNPDFDPPVPADKDSNTRWASGAWFIGPDGSTLAQMPTSTNKGDSKEYMLIHNIPITKK